MTTKHTPGSLRLIYRGNNTINHVEYGIHGPNGLIAKLEVMQGDELAFATLLASAPELLEICKTIFDGIHKGRIILENNGQVLALKQAIAKVEGRE